MIKTSQGRPQFGWNWLTIILMANVKMYKQKSNKTGKPNTNRVVLVGQPGQLGLGCGLYISMTGCCLLKGNKWWCEFYQTCMLNFQKICNESEKILVKNHIIPETIMPTVYVIFVRSSEMKIKIDVHFQDPHQYLSTTIILIRYQISQIKKKHDLERNHQSSSLF